MWKSQLIALRKYLASFFKRDWELTDYPIVLRHQNPDTPAPPIKNLKLVPWCATIVNWINIIGFGDTKEEALADLKRCFDEYKLAHGSVPRPGTRVPLQLPPVNEIQKHVPMARDFFARILNMDFDECFISDRSSLWDFPYEDDEDEAAVFAKIEQVYGVDVSDIHDGNLAQIFSRLEEHVQGRS